MIDSDLKNRKAIKYALTEYGMGADFTLSVTGGAGRPKYELVLLDIALPETDSLRHLRFMGQLGNYGPFRAVLSAGRGPMKWARMISHKRPWQYAWE